MLIKNASERFAYTIANELLVIANSMHMQLSEIDNDKKEKPTISIAKHP